MKFRFLLVAALLPLLPPVYGAEPAATLDEILDSVASPASMEKAGIATIFYTIGRTYKFNVTVDRDVAGETFLRFNGGTVWQLLEYLTDQSDLYMELKDNRVHIRRTKTAFFFIEYPHVNRTASSTTSVTLNPS